MIYRLCCHSAILFFCAWLTAYTYSVFVHLVFIVCSAESSPTSASSSFAVVNKSFPVVLEPHTRMGRQQTFMSFISIWHCVTWDVNNNRRKLPKIFDDESNLELVLASHTMARTCPHYTKPSLHTLCVNIECLSGRVENSKTRAMDQNYSATRFAYKNTFLNNFFVDSMDSERFRCRSSFVVRQGRSTERKTAWQNT